MVILSKLSLTLSKRHLLSALLVSLIEEWLLLLKCLYWVDALSELRVTSG